MDTERGVDHCQWVAYTFVRDDGAATVRLVYSSVGAVASVCSKALTQLCVGARRASGDCFVCSSIHCKLEQARCSNPTVEAWCPGSVVVDTSDLRIVSSPLSWRDVRVNVTGAAFVRGGTTGADLWGTNVGREVALIHMVEVSHR
jgi:hypothetical protein